MVREMRSDHAGETGAVYIYKGITAVASWRQDAQLLAFAKEHGDTEAEHLRLLEAWLPAYRPSRLLVPWCIAGWLTGALPALFGRRAVYRTIAAVETFVDVHYQQQIDHLQQHGGPEGEHQHIAEPPGEQDDAERADDKAHLPGERARYHGRKRKEERRVMPGLEQPGCLPPGDRG